MNSLIINNSKELNKDAFISQFSTKVQDDSIISVDGEYNYEEQRWIGSSSYKMATTHKKTESPLNKDESHDW